MKADRQMTDDEINRRVAEIEEWAPSADYAPPYTTDWAWCGPLVEKHKISILPFCEKWGANPFFYEDGTQYADTPQRAICLAVIATHDKPTTPGIWTGLGDK